MAAFRTFAQLGSQRIYRPVVHLPSGERRRRRSAFVLRPPTSSVRRRRFSVSPTAENRAPPTCRARRRPRDSDYARFTAHPIVPANAADHAEHRHRIVRRLCRSVARRVSALVAGASATARSASSRCRRPCRTVARRRSARCGAVIGALGAMIGSGSAWAWAPPTPEACSRCAPSLGALDRRVRRLAGRRAVERRIAMPELAEAVSVVVDDARGATSKPILLAHGARIERRAPGRRRAADRSRALPRVPFRP